MVRWHATVRAPDPEIAGRLLTGKLQEELRVLLSNVLGPDSVVREQVA